MLQNLVSDWKNTEAKMTRMRKDLERGFLSEVLLPTEELELLARATSFRMEVNSSDL